MTNSETMPSWPGNVEGLRVAAAAMRGQPFHKGHTGILNKMCEDYETVILAIGSTNVFDKWNPFPFEVRKKMIQNIYGDRIRIVPLSDLKTQEGTSDWVDYFLEKIKKVGLPEPTDYFTGSVADSRWYTTRFFLEGVSVKGEFRENRGEIPPHGDIAWGPKRLLHIVDRDQNDIPPATDLRTFLELGCDDWKKWVPKVNHSLVEENYPVEFLIRN